jgi:hypothetical protein
VGFEINLNRLNTSFNSWKVFNTFWFSGIQAGYFGFQDPEVLGGAFILTGYAEPVLSHGKKYLFTLRGGAGFSYHTKIHDYEDNPSNQFFALIFNFRMIFLK